MSTFLCTSFKFTIPLYRSMTKRAMFKSMPIVNEIKEITNYSVVNEMLEEGWILLKISQFREKEYAHPIYHVGKPVHCHIDIECDKKEKKRRPL
jgi:hypothetical protein